MKNKKVIIITGVVFVTIDTALVIALFLTRVGVFFFALFSSILSEAMFHCSISTKNQKKGCTAYTLGVITDVKLLISGRNVMGYIPTVSYTVDGVEYSGDYSFARKSKDYYKIGDEFWVIYNPENPSEFTQEDSDIDSSVKIFRIAAIATAVLTLILTAVAVLSV